MRCNCFYRLFLILSFSIGNPLWAQLWDGGPTCEILEEDNSHSCDFKDSVGLGPQDIILVYESLTSHGASRHYLRNALTRFQEKFDFELVTSQSQEIFTDSILAKTRVLIMSNELNLPTDTIIRRRIEEYVRVSGGGILMYHSACSFIHTWGFLEDVCIQQYFFHNGAGTQGEIYQVEDIIGRERHGLSNPYSSFIFKGLPKRNRIREEFFTWRENPRTHHQYQRESQNKMMLWAVDENSYNSVTPRYPGEHYLIWAHTMGKGLAINHSIGHEYAEEEFRDSLLWREIRYLAKDWGVDTLEREKIEGVKVCMDNRAISYSVNLTIFQVRDNSVCEYESACKNPLYNEYVENWPGKHSSSKCETLTVGIQEENENFSHWIKGDWENLRSPGKISILNIRGEVVWTGNNIVPSDFKLPALRAGIYFLSYLSTHKKLWTKAFSSGVK